ncbi:MAG: DUF362 domain-containing protein [bacterium]|nr:DUF362 domain-containing protein [bacterium]
MISKVFFMNMRANFGQNSFTKFNKLLKKLKIEYPKNALAAVKLHFGEMGNLAFIHPIWVREVVNYIKGSGGNPFLTDTNTLYAGSRKNAPLHIQTALANGFTYACVQAPIIIADGLRGEASVEVVINQKHFKSVTVAQVVHEADVLISLAHFKGHGLAGFGGSLKNMGMGLADRRGKFKMHCEAVPIIKKKGCCMCLTCVNNCSGQAITIVNKMPEIDPSKCLGCGQCLVMCPNSVFTINWTGISPVIVQERMIEFAYGALLGKKAYFLNFIMNVSPDCDCCPHSDANIIPDVGILASLDPVAIDQASIDLVNQQMGLSNTALKGNFQPGEDKLQGIDPKLSAETQLHYAQKIGLGSRRYKLEEV